jgi:hypothetical protein
MGYADKSDQMATSYGMCRRTWKWKKKLFFHLRDLVIVNALNSHRSCGRIMTHKKFREHLIRDLILLSYDQSNSQWDCLWKIKSCSHPTRQT